MQTHWASVCVGAEQRISYYFDVSLDNAVFWPFQSTSLANGYELESQKQPFPFILEAFKEKSKQKLMSWKHRQLVGVWKKSQRGREILNIVVYKRIERVQRDKREHANKEMSTFDFSFVHWATISMKDMKCEWILFAPDVFRCMGGLSLVYRLLNEPTM